MPGFQLQGWNGFFVPKGTPGPIIRKLNGALRKAVASEQFQKRMDELGSLPATGDELTPEYVSRLVPSEIDRFRVLLAESK